MNLHAEQHLLAAAVLESLSEGVVALDSRGNIVSANSAARLLLGWQNLVLDQVSWFATSRQPSLHELVRETLQSNVPGAREVQLFQPAERMLRVQAFPCSAAGAAVVLLLQDITESRRYEELRREFVANVSHELKSPLTSIRSLTETLLDGALEDPGANRRFVSLIEEDTVRLSRLIDDLLTLSKEESQAVPLHSETFSLHDSLEPTCASWEKLLTLELDIPQDLQVSADPDRLRQVFENLLDNAHKYATPPGLLRIAARREAEGVEITVSDRGPGIAPGGRARVFERFYREDKARSRQLGGTGLGLSIVKHIVEAHGGTIRVEDAAEGPGACFRFTLPDPGPAFRLDLGSSEARPDDETDDPQSELRSLQERLLGMAGLVEEAVGRATRALLLRDGVLARRVMDSDIPIDRAEIAIDALCLRLLGRSWPAEGDLRWIAVAYKMNADLERIGDLAVTIARRSLALLQEPQLQPVLDIPRMAEQVQSMVKDALDALVRRDAEAALEVCRRDDEVDRMNSRIFTTMLSSMTGDRRSSERAIALLLIARALERIADHATNIAEGVVYLVSGRTIKHGRNQVPEALHQADAGQNSA